MMLGGVIRGYCATGKLKTATAPARVMTIDRTVAKIGRWMKKWENIDYSVSRSSDPDAREGGARQEKKRVLNRQDHEERQGRIPFQCGCLFCVSLVILVPKSLLFLPAHW
jgi:hypothetical protein